MKWMLLVFKKALKSNQKGQGLTEYAVILSVVAVAAIAATAFFGSAIKAQIASIGASITGDIAQKKTAQEAASAAVKNTIERSNAATSMKIDDAEIQTAPQTTP